MKKYGVWMCVFGLSLLAACGGGANNPNNQVNNQNNGGNQGTNGNSNAVTLSITAAKGAGMAGATITVTDSKGTAFTCPGTSDVDGKLSCTLPATFTAPFVIMAQLGTEKQYSVIPVGGANSVNVTPLTTALVAGLCTSGDPAQFAKEVQADNTKASAKAISEQVTQLNTSLRPVIDVTLGQGVTLDPLAGELKANTGIGQDKLLDTVKVSITVSDQASNVTAKQVISLKSDPESSVTISKTASPVASQPLTMPALPPDAQSQPQAATCPALRSGTYRFVSAQGAQKITVNTTAATITNANNETYYVKPVDADPCHFQAFSNPEKTSANPSDIVVSQSGVGVTKASNGDGTYSLAVFFPEQTGLNTLANAAGKWNTLSIEATSTRGVYAGHWVQSEWGADGRPTTISYCGDDTWNLASCQTFNATAASNATGSMSVNSVDNGYFITSPGQTTPGGKRFIYKTGAGDLIAVGSWSDGSFDISSRQRPLAAPVVSTTPSNYWSLSMDIDQTLRPLTSGSTVIVSVADATSATTSFVRTNVTTGLSPSDLHSETLSNNTPATGFRLRAAGTDTSVTPNQSYSKLYQLPLQGIGITVSLNQTNKRFQLSVTKPN